MSTTSTEIAAVLELLQYTERRSLHNCRDPHPCAVLFDSVTAQYSSNLEENHMQRGQTEIGGIRSPLIASQFSVVRFAQLLKPSTHREQSVLRDRPVMSQTAKAFTGPCTISNEESYGGLSRSLSSPGCRSWLRGLDLQVVSLRAI